jgi:hypothetical protein
MPTDDSIKSENATVNRMANEASDHVADTVQEVVDEVAETHSGKDVGEVVDAVQEKWAAKVGDVAPLPEHKAAEYAQHISDGKNVTVVPADSATPSEVPKE